MTKIISLITLMLLMCMGIQVNAQNCCAQHGSDFQMLALNKDFRDAHLDPIPFNYTPKGGSMIRFATQEAGMDGSAFYVPSDEPTSKVLVIFHEWWGLNDYIKQEAENWQKLLGNVDVYAIDLYDNKVADSAAQAAKLSGSIDEKRGETLIKGLLSHIGNDKLIGTLGWCFGGNWAFQASLLAGQRSAGTVIYYGTPEKDPKKIAELKSDVLYIWASQDKFITKNMVGDFQQAVTKANHKFTLHTFDAVHAFANPSNPKHDRLAAKQAEQLSVKFLKEKLQVD